MRLSSRTGLLGKMLSAHCCNTVWIVVSDGKNRSILVGPWEPETEFVIVSLKSGLSTFGF